MILAVTFHENNIFSNLLRSMERTKSVVACSVLETFKVDLTHAKEILEALLSAWYKAVLPFSELPAGDMVAGDQISPESTPKSENMSSGSKKRYISILMTKIKEKYSDSKYWIQRLWRFTVPGPSQSGGWGGFSPPNIWQIS